MIDQRGAASDATAARGPRGDLRIVPLDDIARSELRTVLDHERECWTRDLDWDFSHTSGLIERSLESRGVAGFGLRQAGRIVAYAYYVAGAARAHIGSVHALPEAEAIHPASLLLERCLVHLTRELSARRVESQFLYFGNEALERTFAAHACQPYERQFLSGPLDPVRARLAPSSRPAAIELSRFRFAELQQVAAVVQAGFVRSADAEMSECYATLEGCLAFVEGVTLREGCGSFDPDSSYVARRAGKLVGVVLASTVSPTVGHIVQLSVRPTEHGRGIGRHLLTAACDALATRGATAVSLSVSTANRRARDWYVDLGLTVVKNFSAWVWRRPA